MKLFHRPPKKRSAFISPPQLYLLDEACKPIREAFDATPYLVGTVLSKPDFRDVDVRLILSDEAFDRFFPPDQDRVRILLGLLISESLSHRTSLPIDFQFQRMTQANRLFDGPRNPLGVRHLGRYIGDAPRD